MKNLFKRAAAASLAAVMTLGLAGCNSDGNSGSSGTNSGSSGTLVIGGIGPVTGENAQYGIAVRNGLNLAAEEINANGGVNGMTLKIEFEDDMAEPEKGLTAYNALKDKDMKLLLGTVTSGSCAAVAVKAAEDNMFLLTPSGSSVACVTAGDNCFRMCFSDPQQGPIAADYIADHLGVKKVGIIYNNASDYSKGIYQGFKDEAGKKGLEIVAEATFDKDTETDFNAQIQTIADSGAELLFCPFYYNAAAMILQQSKDKLDIPVFGGDGLDGLIGLLEDGGNVELAEGVYVMSPYAASSTEPKSVAFTEAYQKKFPNDQVNQFAADAYDCVYAIKQALEHADVKDASISASDLCKKLKAAMIEIEFDGVTGKTKWTKEGEPEREPLVWKIAVKDGKGTYEAAQ